MRRRYMTNKDLEGIRRRLAERFRPSYQKIAEEFGTTSNMIQRIQKGYVPKTALKTGPLADFIIKHKYLKNRAVYTDESNDSKAPYIPSPQEIKEQTAKIRATWSDEEREERIQRISLQYQPMLGYVDDFEISFMSSLDDVYNIPQDIGDCDDKAGTNHSTTKAEGIDSSFRETADSIAG